jgi:hypothetical protein
MDRNRQTTSGFAVVACAGVAAAVAYWIFSAQQPTFLFVATQYVLLASALVGAFGGLGGTAALARRRASR